MAFDIYRGWPLDGSIHDNAPPKEGEGIIEGMAVKKDANGELVKADGTAAEVAGMSLKSQADLDVAFADSMPYVLRNAIMYTDQYVGGETRAIGDALQVSSGGEAGLFKLHTGGAAPVFGTYDGEEIRNGKTMIKIIFAS